MAKKKSTPKDEDNTSAEWKLAQVQKAADQYQHGLNEMIRALAVLPNGIPACGHALHYASTSALWAGEAFTSLGRAIQDEGE
tara:strand:- start:2065 stop:2310 length:246 start_codon:yes stop_codon:yes gene_type:complete